VVPILLPPVDRPCLEDEDFVPLNGYSLPRGGVDLFECCLQLQQHVWISRVHHPACILLLPDLVNGESEVSDISNNCLVAESTTHRITLALQFITKSVMAWGPFGILESLGEFPNA